VDVRQGARRLDGLFRGGSGELVKEGSEEVGVADGDGELGQNVPEGKLRLLQARNKAS
jgi:hypothetical protein